MKLATYNIMFGMDGTNWVSATESHILLHGLNYYFPFLKKHLLKYVQKKSNHVKKAIQNIRTIDPDILCINEVLYGLHKRKVMNYLKERGYKTIGIAHAKVHKEPLDIKTIIASKIKGDGINFDFPNLNKPGKGGCACALYLPSKNTTIIGVHLALGKQKNKQLKNIIHLAEQEKKKKRKVIIMGDFNLTYQEIKNTQKYNNLKLKSIDVRTYLLFNLIRFVRSNVDHIFIDKKIQIKNYNTIRGKSDHLMLYYEI